MRINIVTGLIITPKMLVLVIRAHLELTAQEISRLCRAQTTGGTNTMDSFISKTVLCVIVVTALMLPVTQLTSVLFTDKVDYVENVNQATQNLLCLERAFLMINAMTGGSGQLQYY